VAGFFSDFRHFTTLSFKVIFEKLFVATDDSSVVKNALIYCNAVFVVREERKKEREEKKGRGREKKIIHFFSFFFVAIIDCVE
jgi:hypothetical protein